MSRHHFHSAPAFDHLGETLFLIGKQGNIFFEDYSETHIPFSDL